ncbi:MAG TPA: hypothetical protein VIL36_19350 [Acidimicrobiales bacterium]
MNKVRATLAATGVAFGVLALPAGAGAQEIVPGNVLPQWSSYDAFARQSQADLMRQLFTGRADEGSTLTTTEYQPLEVKKTIQVQDAQSPVEVVIAAVEQAVGIS